jgi:hypothetical protein
VGHAGIDAEDDHVHGGDSARGVGRLLAARFTNFGIEGGWIEPGAGRVIG